MVGMRQEQSMPFLRSSARENRRADRRCEKLLECLGAFDRNPMVLRGFSNINVDLQGIVF